MKAELNIYHSQLEQDMREQRALNIEQVADGLLLDLKTYGRAEYTEKGVDKDFDFAEVNGELSNNDDFEAALFRFYSASQKQGEIGLMQAAKDLAEIIEREVQQQADYIAERVAG